MNLGGEIVLQALSERPQKRLADGTVAFVSADYLAQSGKPE